ncbi:MAG: hypothetical protein ACI4QP_00960 [Candidatus Enteromonas sp.]
MKKAALVLTWVGMGIMVLFYAVMMILGLGVKSKNNLLYALFLIPICLSFLFGFLATKSLTDNEKRTWIGIFSMLLCGFIGGALYLVWEPSQNEDLEKQGKLPKSGEINDSLDSIPNRLLELKDLRDIGAITKKEYEEKRKELLKKF